MNATDRALLAYAPTNPLLRTDRAIEHQAIARVTSRLSEAVKNAATDFPGLVRALHDNRQLWTILAADVSQPENRLPEMLRAQIFYLSEFTSLHTARVLRGEARAEPLVEINKAVLKGLGDGSPLMGAA